MEHTEFMNKLNEGLAAIKCPYPFEQVEVPGPTPDDAPGVTLLRNDISNIICGEDGYTIMSKDANLWLALVVAVFVDTATGATSEQRNKALRRAGVFDGTFAKGKQANIKNGWNLKAFWTKQSGMSVQALRG